MSDERDTRKELYQQTKFAAFKQATKSIRQVGEITSMWIINTISAIGKFIINPHINQWTNDNLNGLQNIFGSIFLAILGTFFVALFGCIIYAGAQEIVRDRIDDGMSIVFNSYDNKNTFIVMHNFRYGEDKKMGEFKTWQEAAEYIKTMRDLYSSTQKIQKP